MIIRNSLGTVLAALFFIAIGAGAAVGVMLWEPWDGGGEDSVGGFWRVHEFTAKVVPTC